MQVKMESTKIKKSIPVKTSDASVKIKDVSLKKDSARKNRHTGLIVLVIMIILIAVYFAFFNGANSAPINNISGTTALTLSSSPELIAINGTTYVISLASSNATQKIANVHITELPSFVNPTYNVTLGARAPVKVGVGSSYANMLLEFENASGSTAQIDVTPIPLNLYETTNATKVSSVNTTLQAFGSAGNPVAQNTSTKGVTTASTTIVSTTVSKTSGPTTSVVTTTVNQAQTENNTVIGALKESIYYPIMSNFSIDYANSVNCTVSAYETSYDKQYGKIAQGAYDYVNVSQETPHYLGYSIENFDNNYSTVKYGVLATNSTYSGTVLTINISRVSKAVVGEPKFSGIFYGINLTTISVLKNELVSAKLVGNACGIYVVAANPA